MFTEDYIQRTLYIFSRGSSLGAIIVLLLSVLLFVGTWFDALLWGLDSPGYILQKSNVTAASIADRLLPEPGYLVFSSSTPGDVGPLDARITDMMGANLFEPGVNFTLTGGTDLGTPKTVAPTRSFDEVGPRIWLDSDGFSVSPDTYITMYTNSSKLSDSFNCPWVTISDTAQAWNCTFDNSFALSLASDNPLGRPEIHWDDVTDKNLRTPQHITPNREDNPWASLGKGGNTALIKQMVTVTKDRMRHTFIVTAFKASLVSDRSIPFSLEEVTDLVKRAWSTDPADQTHPFIYQVANSVVDARSRNSSGVFGLTTQAETSVYQLNYELLNLENFGTMLYSLFRASFVNIRLVRSEELPEPVTPLEPCETFYSNIALGGKVRMTDCVTSSMDGVYQIKPRFLGQTDTSAFLILNGILGESPTNYSS